MWEILTNPFALLWIVLSFFGGLFLLAGFGWCCLCRAIALEDKAQLEREREDEGWA